MRFEATDGRLGKYSLGANLGAESPSVSLLASSPTMHLGKQCWVQRFNFIGGGVVYVAEDGIVDAVGVGSPYSDSVLGDCQLGDLVFDLFVESTDEPTFPATFVECVEHALYFTTPDGFGISVHTDGIRFEDGPWNEQQWSKILDGTISRVIVCRHNNRQLAY